MKYSYILFSTLLVSQSALSQNEVNITLQNGKIDNFQTANLNSIEFNQDQITVNPINGNTITYDGNVSQIKFKKIAEGNITISEAKGWLESAYAEWAIMKGAESYNVYIKGGNINEYKQIDNELVRQYTDYVRADVVGLQAGDYQLRIVPVINGKEVENKASETDVLTVKGYTRSGFAHLNYSGVGAYKDDGTLKENAVVVYVNANNAKTVTANLSSGTFTGLQSILSALEKGNVTNPVAIRIIGCIKDGQLDSYGSSEEGVQIKGKKANSELNLTIEGIGEDATIKGFGFLVRNSKSVEFRNLGIMRQMDDGISLDTNNSNIWIHHIDVFYGKSGSGDHAKGDGSIDVKSDSKYVTIDNCHFWDSGKSSMCGMKSETGPNYITYHHNWFDHSDSRHARIRTMSVHMWNNYFDGNSKYGVGVTTGSDAFVEANYFRNCKFPMLTSLQGNDVYDGSSSYKLDNATFSNETGGSIKSYGNKIVCTNNTVSYWPYGASTLLTKGKEVTAESLNIDTKTNFDAYEASSRDEKVPDIVKALSGEDTYNNFDTDTSLMYSYTPNAAEDVPSIVTGYYGAGRLNHGDLQYTFSDSEDTSSDVNTSLANLIDNYTGLSANSDQQPSANTQDGDSTSNDQTDQDTNQAITESLICSFDKTGVPSNPLFTVIGNGSNSKGTATYNGTTYSTCLKMEGSTSIKFTTTKEMELTLVFGDNETASFKLNGTNYTGNTSIYKITISPDSYEIKKKDSRNLFLITLE